MIIDREVVEVQEAEEVIIIGGLEVVEDHILEVIQEEEVILGLDGKFKSRQYLGFLWLSPMENIENTH